MNFNFWNTVRLITGDNCILENGGVFSSFGKRCLIVTGHSSAKCSGALDDVQKVLEQEHIMYEIFAEAEPNPTLLTAHKGGEKAREFGAEFVIGIGGGSALDAAKAVAVFAANPMEPMEVYGYNWKKPVLPILAVGTTAGTGSEVGPFAVMTMPDGMKASFGNLQTYPKVAFGDARYTMSLPLNFTISTALDALSHALEGYFGVNATRITDLFAVEAVETLMPVLHTLSTWREDMPIPQSMREELYYASVAAGYTLAQCGTCFGHRLGYYFTENLDIPHGYACAKFLPALLHRAQKLMPERSENFFSRVGCTLQELCNLIESCTRFPQILLDVETMEMLVERGKGSGNFKNTAPNGLLPEEAMEILAELFG